MHGLNVDLLRELARSHEPAPGMGTVVDEIVTLTVWIDRLRTLHARGELPTSLAAALGAARPRHRR